MSSGPVPSCQPPLRTEASSRGIPRTTARIRPQVSSMVANAPVNASVPQTVTPSSCAASTSIAALAMPAVTSSRSDGRRARIVAGKGVRSRIATTASKGASRETS